MVIGAAEPRVQGALGWLTAHPQGCMSPRPPLSPRLSSWVPFPESWCPQLVACLDDRRHFHSGVGSCGDSWGLVHVEMQGGSVIRSLSVCSGQLNKTRQ